MSIKFSCVTLRHMSFHGLYIVDHGLIAGSGVQTVGPIALVQDAVLEKGTMIEAESGMAGLVRLYCKTAHGEVGSHPVLYISLRRLPCKVRCRS